MRLLNTMREHRPPCIHVAKCNVLTASLNFFHASRSNSAVSQPLCPRCKSTSYAPAHVTIKQCAYFEGAPECMVLYFELPKRSVSRPMIALRCENLTLTLGNNEAVLFTNFTHLCNDNGSPTPSDDPPSHLCSAMVQKNVSGND